MYDAINKGIIKCEGDIVGIIHGNDYYTNDTFHKVENIFSTQKVDVIYSDEIILRKDGSKFTSSGRNHSFEKNMINHPTFFVKKSVYEKIGYYNIKYFVSADYDFALKIHHDERFIMKYIRDVSFAVHREGGRESREYWINRDPFKWLILLKQFNSIKLKYGHFGRIKYIMNLLKGIIVLLLILTKMKKA